jgi:hypothetical protein
MRNPLINEMHLKVIIYLRGDISIKSLRVMISGLLEGIKITM